MEKSNHLFFKILNNLEFGWNWLIKIIFFPKKVSVHLYKMGRFMLQLCWIKHIKKQITKMHRRTCNWKHLELHEKYYGRKKRFWSRFHFPHISVFLDIGLNKLNEIKRQIKSECAKDEKGWERKLQMELRVKETDFIEWFIVHHFSHFFPLVWFLDSIKKRIKVNNE